MTANFICCSAENQGTTMLENQGHSSVFDNP